MKTAFITLSREGAALYPRLKESFGELDFYLHSAITSDAEAKPFDRIVELTHEIFAQYQGLIYAAPCGIVVRALAACVSSKLSDPAVVVTDVGARWAISLLSGHEGGANQLAQRVANLLDAEAIVTTTTEAVKDLIVGIGCRRGATREQIVDAIAQGLKAAHLPLERVRLLASASIKSDEQGLLDAAEELEIPVRFISLDAIRACPQEHGSSAFVEKSIGVPAVSEPVALLAGKRTSLLLRKSIFNSVTVAIAQENCMSLA